MKRFLTLGVLGAGLLVLPSLSLADTQDQQMVVSRAGAPVMRGHSTLATLPAGHRFQVIRREGPWVGTRTTIKGQTVSGWLWQGHVSTPQQFAQRSAARRYSNQPGTATRRYSYVPGVPGADRPYKGPYPYARPYLWPDSGDYITGGVRSGSPLIMGATQYGRSYWRADRKIIGQ
ncbi:MAG TPA: hypothetical protein VG826_11550 [Pirellulales bacterium]|nr:hypothetical protein [Pirellulales bacterium]